MAKAGMKRYVSNHKGPTYDQALGNIRKQESKKEAADE